MRKTATVIGLLAAAAVFTWANAATVSYKATLASTAEVPPVQSPGKGSAQVNVDTATKQASYRVEFTGLTGQARIFFGLPGLLNFKLRPVMLSNC